MVSTWQFHGHKRCINQISNYRRVQFRRFFFLDSNRWYFYICHTYYKFRGLIYLFCKGKNRHCHHKVFASQWVEIVSERAILFSWTCLRVRVNWLEHSPAMKLATELAAPISCKHFLAIKLSKHFLEFDHKKLNLRPKKFARNWGSQSRSWPHHRGVL